MVQTLEFSGSGVVPGLPELSIMMSSGQS